MRKSRLAYLAIMAACAWIGLVEAQVAPADVPVALRELVPGHYLLTGGRYNGGVISTSDGAIVVDAIGPEDVSRRQRELIERQLGQPVRYLISSTFHNNYTNGNVSFRDVLKIGSERYRADLLALMQREGVAAAEQAARMPTETFRDKMTLYVGGKEVQVLHLGRGHTAGDAIVFVPEDRIAYVSELYFHDEYPNFNDGYGVAWIETLGKVEALDADIFVPAHGVMPDDPGETRAGLHRARERLIATLDAVRREMALGRTADQAIANIQFPEYEGLRSYPAQKDVAVRRMYQELQGQLP